LKLFRLDVAQAITASREAVHGITWNADDYCVHHEFAAVLLTRVIRSYLRRCRLRRVVEQHVSEYQLRPPEMAVGEGSGSGGTVAAQEPSLEVAQITNEVRPDGTLYEPSQ
jgi:hypothetical protein